MRDVVGYEVPLAIDHFGRVSMEDCIKFLKRLEKYNIAWVEDIQPWHLTDHYVRIAESCNVPLATGEDIYLADGFRPLLEKHGIAIAHPDLLSIVDALDLIGKYVRDVHGKDGLYPTNGRELGKETPLGAGKVNFPRLVARLKELGYDGPITIEREISGEEQKRDIISAKAILEQLI